VVLQVRVVVAFWNDEMPNEPLDDVVPREYEMSVPHAKPSVVALAPLVAVIELEAVAPVIVTPENVGVKRIGTATGVTAFEADDGVLVPTTLTAYTAKVYEVPLVRPETTIGETAEVAVKLPGVEDAR
jgi:hypothetical protein